MGQRPIVFTDQMAVRLDPITKEQVLSANIPGAKTTADKLRTLIEWGLEACEEMQ